ncbi:MAG: hypothetical protein HYX28_10755 [Candidatus Koribacter versatilis]|uniref:PilZ domain-containing protein n=1 Tax=Candidatus Korobacter versatilis TaxID=658062 RepID=A0A932AAC6_9BACT|nr:hypothetical protein [Candidatus Koribacter versatilis]
MKAQPRLVRPVHLPLQLAIRFRLLDSDIWHDGLVEDISQEGLAFLSDLPLELGTYLKIALPVPALASMGIELPSTYARVSSRVLDRWPDLRTAITADFLAAPGQQLSGAA